MTGMYAEDDLLPLSLLQHLLFCERRAALVQIEGIWVNNLFTVEGIILHDKVDSDLPVESRGDVRISRGLMLRSFILGLSGKADVVEFHRMDEKETGSTSVGLGTAIALARATGLWRPFPVEYKRGRLRYEAGYEIQLCAQALCLEEMLGCTVPEGALFYGKNRRRKVVLFDEPLRRETAEAAARLHELVRFGRTPPAKYQKKCESCSLMNLCLPKVAGAGKSVGRYLSRMLADTLCEV